ncbi:hypothetical protein GUJ93_ZPchr0002g25105 [Zizania palustris]|uniref:Uncharacterized protein n=1 Tax=Zizania palustris TaxID=103762 RepID=A0A8J5SKU6_ZIZPA|nr:hypothetical protein GUJ93_ZPchr0002g25105 [Zizania palustris]
MHPCNYYYPWPLGSPDLMAHPAKLAAINDQASELRAPSCKKTSPCGNSRNEPVVRQKEEAECHGGFQCSPQRKHTSTESDP